MSWTVSFTKPVAKSLADNELDQLAKPEGEAPADQFRAAKDAAKLLLKSVPGPFISISMSGHANGIGWQKKEGWANDAISVSVTQFVEEDLKYYQ